MWGIDSLLTFFILVGTNRYVDVSTVDGATSKLISEHIKATGALFLEVWSDFMLLSK